MNTPAKHLLIPPHLGDAQIVAYLDGELTRWEMNAAKAHLESCWSCRSRMGEVQHDVDAFLDARSVLLPDESVLADSRVEQFRQRLARYASASEAITVPFHERFAEWRARIRNSTFALLQYRKAVLASVVAVCLLVVMFTDVLNTRVSADTVLLRAASYETSHVPQAGHVTRTSVRVDRIDRSTNIPEPLGTITLVRDSASPVVYVNANSSSGEIENVAVKDVEQIAQPLLHVVFSGDNADPSLVQYLTTQQWIPDLSVAEFRRWLNRVAAARLRRAGRMGPSSCTIHLLPAIPRALRKPCCAWMRGTTLRRDSASLPPAMAAVNTASRAHRFPLNCARPRWLCC